MYSNLLAQSCLTRMLRKKYYASFFHEAYKRIEWPKVEIDQKHFFQPFNTEFQIIR